MEWEPIMLWRAVVGRPWMVQRILGEGGEAYHAYTEINGSFKMITHVHDREPKQSQQTDVRQLNLLARRERRAAEQPGTRQARS